VAMNGMGGCNKVLQESSSECVDDLLLGSLLAEEKDVMGFVRAAIVLRPCTIMGL